MLTKLNTNSTEASAKPVSTAPVVASDPKTEAKPKIANPFAKAESGDSVEANTDVKLEKKPSNPFERK